VHWPEDHHVRKLVLQRPGERDGLGDVHVRRQGVRPQFQVRQVPQLGLVVQADESGVRGIRGKNSHAEKC
jgi:hypothetical protein